jgi:hypothetical protein
LTIYSGVPNGNNPPSSYYNQLALSWVNIRNSADFITFYMRTGEAGTQGN